MNIPIYEIENNERTGYFNIVDTSTGKRYGEYITYEEAEDALDNNTFDNSESEEIELPPAEYVVCREYISHRQHYVMFTRGKLSDHVSYPESSTLRRLGFNDTSIKIYNTKEQAKLVAKRFNEISREKKYYRYANWKAMAKWW